MRGLITAIRTLTVLRVPGRDAGRLADALYYFPFAGALIGVAVGLVVFLIERYTGWRELGAVLGVLVSLRMTGCLHLDGLADVSDSFGASSRERRLEIMKDSRSGVYGVAAIVVSLLMKYICLMRIEGIALLIFVPVVMAVSRAAQVGVMVGMPYARQNGTAGPFVDGAAVRHVAVAGLLATGFAFYMAGQQGLMIVAISGLVTIAVRIWARRQLGGITGDVIGFTNELVEIICLAAAGVAVSLLV